MATRQYKKHTRSWSDRRTATVRKLEAKVGAGKFLPSGRTIPELRAAAATCKGCELWRNATQTVFGEGSERAKMVLVGEQPGDQEDLKGIPFSGPAGQILDRGLVEAGIDREEVYITNAVKHFKWSPRGKRRLHQKPNSREITACRPWIVAELEAVQPQVLVCLGATAARSVLGKTTKISEHRGELLESDLSCRIFVTVHPSSILRIEDSDTRQVAMRRFVEDLRTARNAI
ncbi:MAG TPA: UdgX family uracil-DNA binding protein [Chthoniobacterales bacterium]|nr:UdgX family uracil-DNA binding protein [Chthoniobacterales bacterium]